MIFPTVKAHLEGLNSHFSALRSERRQLLMAVADYIMANIEQERISNLIFICTHNSRRSHFGQVWAAIAATYYGLGDKVKTFSGGTEVTAPHFNMINALLATGLQSELLDTDLMTYRLTFGENEAALKCFSKVYDNPQNPNSDFAAIMTCTHADQNCPFIAGAEKRFSLPYEDPKIADETPDAANVYEERSNEIATEMMFIFKQVSSKL